MSKYIDLEDTLLQSCHKAHDYPFVMDVKIVLAWLDSHPDQAPGRTHTASEFDEAVESCITEDGTVPPHEFAERLGVVCVPDPEPTESVPGRTITQSDYQRLMDDTSMPYGVGFTDGFHQAGGSIIDDPEPTNAELLEALLEGGDINAQWGLRGGGVMFARELAHALDEAGVKAPGESDDGN